MHEKHFWLVNNYQVFNSKRFLILLKQTGQVCSLLMKISPKRLALILLKSFSRLTYRRRLRQSLRQLNPSLIYLENKTKTKFNFSIFIYFKIYFSKLLNLNLFKQNEAWLREFSERLLSFK